MTVSQTSLTGEACNNEHMYHAINSVGELVFHILYYFCLGCFYVIEFGKEIQHIPLMFYNEIVRFEKTSELQERLSRAKRIFDMYIMPDLLTREQVILMFSNSALSDSFSTMSCSHRCTPLKLKVV
jgi:hypothetical protein